MKPFKCTECGAAIEESAILSAAGSILASRNKPRPREFFQDMNAKSVAARRANKALRESLNERVE